MSQTSELNCVSTVSLESLQLIKCLLQSRFGEIWIARQPPSTEEIKIKICSDSVVQMYDIHKNGPLVDV